jgi:hypothetical protein
MMKIRTIILGVSILCFTFLSNISLSFNYVSTVAVCRNCSLVVQYSGDRLYPDNRQISQKCNSWEGHLWYNAGTSGQNVFKCQTCRVKVSIGQKKPWCMSFCEEACRGLSKHNWIKLN